MEDPSLLAAARPGAAPVPLHAPAAPAPLGALTVDVEDWYQSCVDFDAPISERVVRNVERMLEWLDGAGATATFFVQGLVAEAFPGLVARLVAGGHEVQSHAHTHRPLDRMQPAALRDELARGKAAVEDAAGTAVTAFRAPDFTIGAGNLWALDVLAELGFTVDSSIFPVRTGRYGIAGWDPAPQRLVLAAGAELLEVPVAVWTIRSRRIPVAGGGYMRVAPYAVLAHALGAVVREGRPPVVYCHPYEFSTTELADYRGRAPERFRRQQGIGRGRFPGRLARLQRTFRLGRLDATLAAWSAEPVREAA